jgi:DNA-binding NtrC family response regulator
MQLLRDIRANYPEIPVVMVSGFLDNDTVRDLIREGIRGVFLKPLNIFSLLKKAGDLIDNSRAERAATGGLDVDSGHAMLSSYPCLDPLSRTFAGRLREAANFRRNLVLLGPDGLPFAGICADVCGLSDPPQELILLESGEVDNATVAARLAALPAPADGSVTLAVLGADNLKPAAARLLRELAGHQGAWQACARPVRMVFCMQQEVDALYDAGRIDEDFYLFLGANELKAPALAEIPRDIPVLAEACLHAIQPGLQLEPGLRSFLCRQPWPGNHAELRQLLTRAVRLAGGRSPRLEHLQKAISKAADSEARESGTHDLQGFLMQEKAVYDLALRRLSSMPTT